MKRKNVLITITVVAIIVGVAGVFTYLVYSRTRAGKHEDVRAGPVTSETSTPVPTLESTTPTPAIEATMARLPTTVADSCWPMFRHDLRHTGRSDCRGPEEATLKWRYATGGRVASSPAVDADGTVYVGAYVPGPDLTTELPIATDTLHADRECYLYALNPDGSLKWRKKTGERIESSPAIGVEGTVYVGSHDRYLYALTRTGSPEWRFGMEMGRYNIHISSEKGVIKQWIEPPGFIFSSPVMDANGIIYFGSGDHHLYALHPDGFLKWRHKTGDAIFSSPAVGTDGTLYSGSHDRHVYAIHPDGSLNWRYRTGAWVFSSPAIAADGTIYVGSDYLYSLDQDGSLKWRYKTGELIDSSPAIGGDGTIYFGSDDGYLYALNERGDLKWRYESGGMIDSSPAIGGDGTIYFGSGDHYVYALRPDGQLKWRFRTGGVVGSSPVIGADGTLYVGSGDGYVYAIGEVEPE